MLDRMRERFREEARGQKFRGGTPLPGTFRELERKVQLYRRPPYLPDPLPYLIGELAPYWEGAILVGVLGGLAVYYFNSDMETARKLKDREVARKKEEIPRFLPYDQKKKFQEEQEIMKTLERHEHPKPWWNAVTYWDKDARPRSPGW